MRELTDGEYLLLKAKSWEALAHLRERLLDVLQQDAQRLEASLVLTEDQRDAARAELEALRQSLRDATR